ncbi:MAG: hypothetical protein IT383_19915 [Deltaproteobacteria bacterium]|nr:hypothetical protein [Deltaproteobacteria bacterium]
MPCRTTNVDVDNLARRPLVRAFMRRILEEERDPATGHVFAATLAKRAAEAFDLYFEDCAMFPRALVDVAEQVIAEERAAGHGTGRTSQ